MRILFKNFVSLLLILLTVSVIFSFFAKTSEKEKKEISLTQLVKDINQEQIKEIIVTNQELEIIYQNDDKAYSRKEANADLGEVLTNYGAEKDKLLQSNINIKEIKDSWVWLGPVLFGVVPFLLIGFFFWLVFRQAKTGATQAFDFTKTKARLFGAEGHPKEKITFKDVAGLKEAKEELKEIVDFLKNPKKYLQIGARIPKGVLLVGPAGCGKTLLARAVAGESNVPFFSVAGSSFVELFVGTGAARARDLFLNAKKHQPCLIFIDELDSVGKVRGPAITGGHEEREQTLNQLLTEMDGFESNDKIIVLAATNRPDVLDPALLRPGRFDRKVVLDLPDINDREETLKIHCKGKPLALNVNLREVAERTPGFSGADLSNLANEAAILAARRNKTQIFQDEFLESFEKVLLGPERKSHILSKKEKEIAAFHEAGHALVSSFLPGAEPVRKISIIARGSAAGYVLKMPAEERRIKTKTEFLAEMSTLLGGYCAEKLIFGEMTTGAKNDLERASQLARSLVKEYGMSKLGPISFGGREESLFLGREYGEEKNYSEKVAAQIDEEVNTFIRDAESRTKKILADKKTMLTKIATTLIEKETIEKEAFASLIKGDAVSKDKVSSDKNKEIDKKAQKQSKHRETSSAAVKIKVKRV